MTESNPFQELAETFSNHIERRTSAVTAGVSCLLGTMTETLALKLDGSKYEIQDYLLADYLTLASDFMTITEKDTGQHPHGASGGHSQYTGDGVHSHPGTEGGHNHNVVTPNALKPLKVGDRVLVVQVNGGQDFVIIARVVTRDA